MGKKSRRRDKKGVKVLKTMEERRSDIDTIKEKLTSLGLSEEMDGVAIFYKRAEHFIETGESWSGKIKLEGCKRILDLILTGTKGKECLAGLLYDKTV
jgi:hypothetical protein